MQNLNPLSHNGQRAQLKRLTPVQQRFWEHPLSIWGPRGRVAIYPALTTDEWEWLEWSAASSEKRKKDLLTRLLKRF